jgi:hypothetical protein
MPRRSLILPLTVLGAFAALVILLMLGALPTPIAAQGDECATTYPTPGSGRDDCYRTATAQAPQGYPSPSATSGGGAPAPQATATISATATLSVTSTPRPTNTAGPTSTPTATRQPQGSPTPSATSTLVGLETLVCVPGATVGIRGRAEPGTALLAYFNGRPVGGTFTRPDGTYVIALSVGNERPGVYPVNVRERDTRALVRELACEVPGAEPTPTQSLVP